jgi:murein DD-endopeptidase MepM/ murein hydrolase activator NlpD
MMSIDPAFAWTFAAACAGSLLVAALALALMAAAGRRWPALAAHRSAWALAQAVVALVFVSALVPERGAGLLPVVHLEAASTDVAVSPLRAAAVSAPPDTAAHTTESESLPDLAAAVSTAALRWLPLAWLGAWLAGLCWSAVRQVRAALRWKAVRAACRVLDAGALHAAGVLSGAQLHDIRRYKLDLRETGMAISPVLLGIARPCLLLPVHMACFDKQQQQMIIEHELTHWRRRDPAWLAASSLLQLLCWFNLPLRGLARGLKEAVELGCDDAVLAGRPQRERHAYAAALVAQLRLRHTGLAPAFGALGVTARVARMRDTSPARLGAGGRTLVAAAAMGLALGAALVQPAFSSPEPPAGSSVNRGTAPASAADSAAPAAPPSWRYPLEQVRVTSTFGIVSDLLPNGHRGIDFAARRGTPVHAVAPGRVAETGRAERYGNFVRIDHGAGRESLMIHLDSIAVQQGDRVPAGQLIGAAGATGAATGPHLHLEYWQDGHRRDPREMFPDLDAHTTAKALARRRAQLIASIPQE